MQLALEDDESNRRCLENCLQKLVLMEDYQTKKVVDLTSNNYVAEVVPTEILKLNCDVQKLGKMKYTETEHANR